MERTIIKFYTCFLLPFRIIILYYLFPEDIGLFAYNIEYKELYLVTKQ